VGFLAKYKKIVAKIATRKIPVYRSMGRISFSELAPRGVNAESQA
jgi:hypothetical protein